MIQVILPFVIGVILAYLLNPMVEYFVAIGWKRDRVVLILYLLFLGSAGLALFWVWPKLVREANAAISEAPSYAAALDRLVDDLNRQLRKFIGGINKSDAGTLLIPFKPSETLRGLIVQLPKTILNMAHIGMWVLIVPFVTYFTLSHGKRWIDGIFSLTPAEYVESLLGLFAELNATLGAYVRGILLESMCVGFLTMAGLLMLGVEGAVLLGIITGLVNFIPFMAPLIGGGLALGAAYFQGVPTSILLGICLLILSVRLVDDFILIPFVVGSSVKIHPVVIVFAVLTGLEIGGFLGLVFAIPVAVVVKVVLSLMLRKRKETVMVKQHVYS